MERSLLALILSSSVLFSVVVLVCFPGTTEARMVVAASSAIDDNVLNPSTEVSMERLRSRRLSMKALTNGMKVVTTLPRREESSPPAPAGAIHHPNDVPPPPPPGM